MVGGIGIGCWREDTERHKEPEVEKRLHCGACENRRAVVDETKGRVMFRAQCLFFFLVKKPSDVEEV